MAEIYEIKIRVNGAYDVNALPTRHDFIKAFSSARQSVEVNRLKPSGSDLCSLCLGNKHILWAPAGHSTRWVPCIDCNGVGYISREPEISEAPGKRKIVLDDPSD